MDRKILIKQVITEAAELLNVEKSDMFIRNIFSFVNQIKLDVLQSKFKSLEELSSHIAHMYKDTIQAPIAPKHDHNDFLNKNMNDKPTHSFAPLTTWLSEQSPTLTSKTTTIYLDSRFRDTSYDGSSIKTFKYNLVPKNMSKGNGNVPSRIIPYNITYFQISKIILPYAGTLASRNLTKEINLAFVNLLSNSVDTSSNDFHFSFISKSYETNWSELTPINNMYKFYPPIKNLESLNLQFYDPYEAVQFYPDSMYASQVNYISSDGRFTFASPHNLTTGDIVIISDFSTNDDGANTTIIQSITDTRGIAVTVINANVIAIGIDFSTIVSPNSSIRPLVQFLRYTFRIAIEIGYQDEK